jgi:hypothetical protein
MNLDWIVKFLLCGCSVMGLSFQYHRQAERRIRNAVMVTRLFCLVLLLSIFPQQLRSNDERDGSEGELGGHFDSLKSLSVRPVDLKRVGLFGFSSGAFAALQFTVSHPKRIMGLALEAGGSYKCSYLAARASLPKGHLPSLVETDNASSSACTEGQGLDPKLAVDAATDTMDKRGLYNFRRIRVWLMHGTGDRVVSSNVTSGLREFFSLMGNSQVKYEEPEGFLHAHIIDRALSIDTCIDTTEQQHLIANCPGFDAPYKALTYIYGMPHISGTKKEFVSSELHLFSQRPYVRGERRTSMADDGLIYVPEICNVTRCTVLIALHGCYQGEKFAGDYFARNSGFNEWAEAFRVIVLYPRISADQELVDGGDGRLTAVNPDECWDWWGYSEGRAGITGAYAGRKGAQMRILDRMLMGLPVDFRSFHGRR